MTPLLHLLVVLAVFALGKNLVRWIALCVLNPLEYGWIRRLPLHSRCAPTGHAIEQLRAMRQAVLANLR